MGKVVVIVGPTASGKTALAQALALQIGGEVVSADSMQVYKGLDIGTGKLLPEDRLVPHYGFDIALPDQPYSAALFQDYARKCFADIFSRGKQPILCGGTGFYVRAAIDAYDFPKGEQVDNPVREKCLAFAAANGSQALWERLSQRDSESAAVIPPNDTKRVARAFELLSEGTSYAQQKENLASIPEAVPSVWIGLKVDPDILRKRIDDRVDAMFADGLVEEVRGLLDLGLREAITAGQAIGYKEVVAALDGKQTLDEAKEQIKHATHRYAKRQRTWFRKEARIHWVDADSLDLGAMTSAALNVLANEGDIDA